MADESISLKEYFEALLNERDKRFEAGFEAQEKAVSAALAAAEKAVLKAENAADKRFESVNEFRGAMGDLTKTFISRAEVEQVVKSLTEKVDGTSSRMDRLEGRSGGINQGWVYLVGAISLVGIVVGIFLGLR